MGADLYISGIAERNRKKYNRIHTHSCNGIGTFEPQIIERNNCIRNGQGPQGRTHKLQARQPAEHHHGTTTRRLQKRINISNPIQADPPNNFGTPEHPN